LTKNLRTPKQNCARRNLVSCKTKRGVVWSLTSDDRKCYQLLILTLTAAGYHGSVYTVVRATSQSYEDSQISGGQHSKTFEPIDEKYNVGDKSAMTQSMPKFKRLPYRARQ